MTLIPRRLPLRTLLVLSVALNLFFVGMIVAHMLREPRPPDPVGRARAAVARLIGRLDAADAAILRQSFGATDPALDAAQLAMRGDFDRAHTLMRVEPLDSAALEATMAHAVGERQRISALLARSLTDAVEQMSPAGRLIVARYRP